MIKISGNDIIQNGEKIGWITGNDIFNTSNQKIGYFIGDDIFNSSGNKIAFVDGGFVRTTSGRNIPTQSINSHVLGSCSETCRAAIKLLFGD